jgi:pimeloyl-ACP methyl ester carboxylesterase
MAWILLLALPALPLAYVAVRRRIIARGLRVPAGGIDERGYVRIGGVDQWVQARGTDRTNPVLLVLHPHGLSMVPLTPLFSLWEKHFTVVLWDRRTVGRTRARNRHAGTGGWTFDRFVVDGIELAEHLRARLRCDRIVLLAHSQGTVVGTRMAAQRPDLFRAYVGVGQMVDMPRNEEMAYERTLELARTRGAGKAVRALETLGRPPYPDPARWIRRLRAAMAVDTEFGPWQRLLLARAFTTPGCTPADIVHLMTDAVLLPQGLYDETMAVTPQSLGTRFEVPVILLHGDADLYAMPELAREYVDAIEAPAKAYVPLPGYGHMVPLLAPDLLGQTIATRVAASGSLS